MAVLGSAGPRGIFAPATILNMPVSEADQLKLDQAPDSAVIPLALASVTVNDKGDIKSVQLLASRDGATREWFAKLIRNLRFIPASRAGEPVASVTLVRIKALQNRGAQVGTSAAEDPWVEQYIAGFGMDDLPFVNELVALPVKQVRTATAPAETNLFQYFPVGTAWGSGTGVLCPTSDTANTRVFIDWCQPEQRPRVVIRK
jgi:hypothetical protein